ncbi:hypothetical protein [Flectobacillus rivi]|uniref:N-acetyltransferase domain-containing protein n=1 Tax=Flectobacillus rivi TaxID=2984209 RepID=A0ABT6YXK0_9BACT|nr:hypothetical protein [Flectobacillus rivi]MDI9873071.1 hypothetical protein [Flectobacillus rivi]
MQEIIIKEVISPSELKTFVYLSEKLHEKRPNWVPPIYADEWIFFDHKKNPAFEVADTIFFLAYMNDKPVGKIMGIIHREYNELQHIKEARFFHLDSIENIDVVKLLIDAVQSWAKAQHMETLVGPFGFSEKDPQGFQIEGFKYLPVIATATNPPYLPQFLETLGFDKLTDCVVYKIDIPAEIPPFYQRIFDRAQRNPNIKLLNFTSKKALKPYVVPIFRLVNETYKDLLGFVPLSEAEMQKIAKAYLPILDPDFVKIIVDENNEPIAFVVGLPDMSKGLKKARGRLFPFGFVHILLDARKNKQLDLLLGAVKPNYRGLGLTTLLGVSMIQAAQKRKMEFMDTHLVLETNHTMRGEAEKLNGEVYKKYRIFQKAIL